MGPRGLGYPLCIPMSIHIFSGLFVVRSYGGAWVKSKAIFAWQTQSQFNWNLVNGFLTVTHTMRYWITFTVSVCSSSLSYDSLVQHPCRTVFTPSWFLIIVHMIILIKKKELGRAMTWHFPMLAYCLENVEDAGSESYQSWVKGTGPG